VEAYIVFPAGGNVAHSIGQRLSPAKRSIVRT